MSPMLPRMPPLGTGSPCAVPPGALASWVRFCSISKADSRSITVSYLPLTGLLSMIAWRSSGETGPTRADRRADQASLHHRRRAVAFEEGHQRLALPQFGDHRGGVELGILPERLRRRPHRLLVARREGAQRVLHAVAELRRHLVRHVERILGDEIDADALGADQPHHLLDLVEQRLGRVGEQEMRLVEEEHELRLVADRRPRAVSSNSSDSIQSRKVA